MVSIESFLKILNHILQYSGLRSASSHFLTSGFPRTRAFPKSQSTFSTGRGDDGSHIDGYLLGEGRIGAHVIQYSLSKTLWQVLDTFPKTAWTHLLTGFLKPSAPFLYPWHGHRSDFSSLQFNHSVLSDSLPPYESQHTRPPCPSPTHGVHPNSCPSSW